MDRRRFLSSTMGCLATAGFAIRSLADELPAVRNPRATSGDDRAAPPWEKRLTITVGPKKADLVGTDDRVLQAAVDYVTRLGGGTVHVLPGTYTLRNAVYLQSGIRVLGSGAESIVTKIPSESVKLAADSDWYDQEITVENAKSFRVGDGVCLRTKNPHNGSTEVLKRTLVARSGNRFKLDRALRKNFWIKGSPTCSSLFPLFSGENISDVAIENITLDGNGKNNTNLNGNYAGCIFLQDCNRIQMRNVEARNYNGDGISWQICHDVVVENCHSHDHAGLGLHPGSGSQRPLIRNNRMERNSQGLFWCWGVKFGLAENNKMIDNRDYGISIGHCDTDNVMRNNEIIGSGKVGILFRNDTRGQDFWANRNRIEKNRIINSGASEGIGIDIQGSSSTFDFDAATSIAGAVGNSFLINGGTASVTYSGDITHSTAGTAAVSVTGGHTTGTVTFQTGTISATDGTGLQFDNADGTYNFTFTNTTTLNGGDAGIDILNGSGGSFFFGANVSITDPTGIAFNLANSVTGTVQYDGTIDQANNAAIVQILNHDFNTDFVSVSFESAEISATNGSGIQINNANGSLANYNF
ncbi:MAG: right-handed parallel beta-helix repeat-containing protein, partial [Planctomycetes bacterium]|nr:right-handed parallel beta-helix repeat-containing protein [Planctomycetota bacterium]